ncbi:MAG: glycosyltransferase [Candidatus Kerfeldbacteria bacterium]
MPYLEKAGIQHKLIYPRKNTGNRLMQLLKDLADLIQVVRCDVIFIQKRKFPRKQLWLMKLLNQRIVYDFDDATFAMTAEQIRQWAGFKMDNFYYTLEQAAAVVVSNNYLKDFTRKFNDNVRIIPSCIEMKGREKKVNNRTSDQIVLGYTCNPENLKYLHLIHPALKKICQAYPNVYLKVVSSEKVELEGVRTLFSPFSVKEHIRNLQSFNIGLMPYPDEPWLRGKAGYKGLECMSVGVPVVASPVGVIPEIIDHRNNGLLAETTDEWIEALARLIEDPGLRDSMGEEAYAVVNNRFSTQIWANELIDLLSIQARSRKRDIANSVRFRRRKHGISVLIASQNEEATISLCIRSFLDFADEIIVVDNGSTDNTKMIIKRLEKSYPGMIKYYDRPDITHLSDNRQFAYEHSSYQWVVRCDADFIAYTDGQYSIKALRDELLSKRHSIWPEGYYIPQVNVVGDFWHTGTLRDGGTFTTIGRHMIRIYKAFPFFRFIRRGRWEGVRFQKLINKREWGSPVWMHCSLKSDMNFFLRSERSNWREHSDFSTYPTVESYVISRMNSKYDTTDFSEASQRYMQETVFPLLALYDPKEYFPYPKLVEEQMRLNPIYKIVTAENGYMKRKYHGVNNEKTI